MTDAATTHEEDTCSPRYTTLSHLGTTVLLQEEQSLDPETSHAIEELCVFLAE